MGQARQALAGPLRAGLAASAPAELKEIESQLDRAGRAVATGDSVGLAASRGTITAALRRGAFNRAIALTAAGRAAAAREWLQIRDFRQSTRFTRVGTVATDSLIELAQGDATPAEAVIQVRKDLLDTYQSRLGTNREEAEKAADRGFPERLAETSAIVDGVNLKLESATSIRCSDAGAAAVRARASTSSGAFIPGAPPSLR